MIVPVDHLPRIFQANLHRFYTRVVTTAIDSLEPAERWELGTPESLDAGLDRARAQVNAHTRNEAAKAFVLVLSALFERQLRHWASFMFSSPRKPPVQTQGLEALLADCIAHAGIDGVKDGVAEMLIMGHNVANVVRHGDGKTSAMLRASAPQFWQSDPQHYVDINAGPSPDSSLIVIPADHLLLYTRAGLRFWGRADRLSGAIEEPPI